MKITASASAAAVAPPLSPRPVHFSSLLIFSLFLLTIAPALSRPEVSGVGCGIYATADAAAVVPRTGGEVSAASVLPRRRSKRRSDHSRNRLSSSPSIRSVLREPRTCGRDAAPSDSVDAGRRGARPLAVRGGALGKAPASSSSSSTSSSLSSSSSSSSSLDSSSWLRRRLVVTLVATALFNDMLQLTMLLPIIPTLISSPPPLGVKANAEIAMGVFFASKDILQLSTAPLAGMLTARTSSTAALLLSTIGLALATFVFADACTFRQLLLARSCQGAASAATMCGGLSLISETFPTEVRGSAMGMAYTGLALGLLCGPLVGGLLFDRYGRRTTFRLAAAAVLANAVAQVGLMLLSPPPPARAAELGEDAAGNAKPGLRSLGALVSNRDVRSVALATAAVNGALGVLKPLSQVVLHREFDMGVTRRSLVISIATAAYLVITPVAGRISDRMPRATLVALSLVLMAASTAFFALRHLGLWAVNVCVGLAGASLAFAGSVGQALMADLVDRHRLGEYGMAFALSDMADSSGLIIGPIVGLAFSQWFGPSAGAGLMGMACLALAPIVMRIPH